MLNKKQFIEEEKDCASMLGLTLEEYRQDLARTKVNNIEEKTKKKRYDNTILYKLGLSQSDLKKRKVL